VKMTTNLLKTLYLGKELTPEEHADIPHYRAELHFHVLYKTVQVLFYPLSVSFVFARLKSSGNSNIGLRFVFPPSVFFVLWTCVCMTKFFVKLRFVFILLQFSSYFELTFAWLRYASNERWTTKTFYVTVEPFFTTA
jgi:hypothetical protein